MKNKKIILAVVALVVLAAVLLGVWYTSRPQATQGEKSFTLTVVHSDGTAKEFTFTTDEEYVGAVLTAEGLLVGEEGPYGLYIHEVDGERAVYEESGAYWSFYVGEEYATTGIDLTPVEDGVAYKLAYEVYE